MSAQPKFYGTNVVQLRGGMTSTSPPDAPPASTAFGYDIGDLVTTIEALSRQLVAEKSLRAPSSAFDAVYISALKADVVPAAAIGRIKAFARVRDRSGELDFQDGLDE